MLEITMDKFHHLKRCCPPAGDFLLFVAVMKKKIGRKF